MDRYRQVLDTDAFTDEERSAAEKFWRKLPSHGKLKDKKPTVRRASPANTRNNASNPSSSAEVKQSRSSDDMTMEGHGRQQDISANSDVEDSAERPTDTPLSIVSTAIDFAGTASKPSSSEVLTPKQMRDARGT